MKGNHHFSIPIGWAILLITLSLSASAGKGLGQLACDCPPRYAEPCGLQVGQGLFSQKAAFAPAWRDPTLAFSGKPIYGITAGLGTGAMRINYDNNRVFTYDQSTFKSIGPFIEFPLEVLDGNWSIYNELTYNTFTARGSSHAVDTSGGKTTTYDSVFLFEPSLITLTHLIKYNLTPNNFKYFIGVGFYNSFMFSAGNSLKIIKKSEGSETISYQKAVDNAAIHGLMLILSTGFTYRNIGLEVRFDPGRNYSRAVFTGLYAPVFSAHMQFRFGVKSE